MSLDKDKKIEIQQQELYRLDSENEELRNQITDLKLKLDELKDELEIEKNKPKEGYEKAKEMMKALEDKQAEYIDLIDSLNELKEKYNHEISEAKRIKEKYQERVVSTLWEIKHSIDDM